MFISTIVHPYMTTTVNPPFVSIAQFNGNCEILNKAEYLFIAIESRHCHSYVCIHKDIDIPNACLAAAIVIREYPCESPIIWLVSKLSNELISQLKCEIVFAALSDPADQLDFHLSEEAQS